MWGSADHSFVATRCLHFRALRPSSRTSRCVGTLLGRGPPAWRSAARSTYGPMPACAHPTTGSVLLFSACVCVWLGQRPGILATGLAELRLLLLQLLICFWSACCVCCCCCCCYFCCFCDCFCFCLVCYCSCFCCCCCCCHCSCGWCLARRCRWGKLSGRGWRVLW